MASFHPLMVLLVMVITWHLADCNRDTTKTSHYRIPEQPILPPQFTTTGYQSLLPIPKPPSSPHKLPHIPDHPWPMKPPTHKPPTPSSNYLVKPPPIQKPTPAPHHPSPPHGKSPPPLIY
ncbi:protein TRACHEARY ELEMENT DIFFERENTIATION-RELATED 7A-like [Impatiens glandulifera]|uniref:protein TRACHEARY ELEMENT DIFFERENTIATION-RELATED 7A-like n=1 Tax=Impatiens glandulifera TaxID=253017 RepID=UPI001FB1741F|nr:protein TRACHEARY ELEMENT DIFFERENTIATION-RELATED 7A-like [Impatiens glandulifera]